MLITGLITGLSLLLFVLAAPPYVIDTLRGHTKPERTTWLILSVLGIVSFVAQLQMGATWSLVFMGLDTFSSICVFGLSLRYGEGGWTWLDGAGLVIAILGVAISMMTHAPVLAVVGSIMADISAMALTLRKTFYEPESETTISWVLVGTGALCSALAVRAWNLELLLYPMYVTIASYSIPGMQVLGRLRMRVVVTPELHTQQVMTNVPLPLTPLPMRRIARKVVRRVPVDMYESGGKLIVRAHTAAARKHELDISLSDNYLTIRGKLRHYEKDVENHFLQECSWGEFTRMLTLPFAVDHKNAEATLQGGVLTIAFSKLEQNAGKRILVLEA